MRRRRSALRPAPHRCPRDGELGHGGADPGRLPDLELALEVGHVLGIGVEADRDGELVLDPQQLELLANLAGIVALHHELCAHSSVRPNVDHERATIGILRGVSRRRSLVLGFLAVVAAAAGMSACGDANSSSSAGSKAAADVGIEPLPARNPRAKAVEPVAGESAEYATLPTEKAGDQPVANGASAPLSAAARKKGSGPSSDAAISDAQVLKNGIALPPIEAPQAVHQIIEAGNQIARTPYLWGGGHGKWLDTGYDCSGSVSFALAAAGLLSGPLASGPLMTWGKPGKGRWVTIYTNPGHVWMAVAGVRFDTSGNRVTGSRWQATLRPPGGYVARHPPGL